jgi:HD-GYP domain-containing protein (c-di-GMP phosphodiesterase class II)
MKLHPTRGSELLDEIEFPGQVAEIAHQHHERLDGSGYPRGLKGDEILLGARVLAVADVADAMLSDRPYRSAPGLGAAVEELQGHPEKYDPVVVAACVAVLSRG